MRPPTRRGAPLAERSPRRTGDTEDYLVVKEFRHPVPIGASVAVIGHGKSPEGRGWGPKIDAYDAVVRMWDCHWQTQQDHGARYDYGLYEAHPRLAESFNLYRRLEPRLGWIASILMSPERSRLVPRTELVWQEPWCVRGRAMGGVGVTGRLQLTRGTIATLWSLERCERGGELLLVGFDNVRARITLTQQEGYSQSYLRMPGAFPFHGYVPGKTKQGNHDFAVEEQIIQQVAAERGVTVRHAADVFADDSVPVPVVQDAPPLPRTLRRTSLLIGDAVGGEETARQLLQVHDFDAVAATNRAGVDWPGRLDYWVTLHPAKCPDWPGMADALRHRLQAGRNRPETWAHRGGPGIDKTIQDWGGSTGLLAVKVLLQEGFDRIVLAGMPLSAEGAHYYQPEKPWNSARSFQRGWQRHLADIQPFVRSTSGWTRELLGDPTIEWLES